jgi:3-oxoacyl-[acyl-carrier protein] reductase
MSNQPVLVDKVALVLGGSRGIGVAIARRLAADGAMVALTYANSAEKAAETARAAEAHGQPVITIKADSADPKAVVDAVAQTIARFGHLDILVVNAGILIHGTVDMYDLADFDRMVATNVRGVFVAIQASTPHLREGGRIITIGSNTAVRTAFPGASVYSMTKGAVASLVRGIAIDLAPRGIMKGWAPDSPPGRATTASSSKATTASGTDMPAAAAETQTLAAEQCAPVRVRVRHSPIAGNETVRASTGESASWAHDVRYGPMIEHLPPRLGLLSKIAAISMRYELIRLGRSGHE